jgi:hypothetical protein
MFISQSRAGFRRTAAGVPIAQLLQGAIGVFRFQAELGVDLLLMLIVLAGAGADFGDPKLHHSAD